MPRINLAPAFDKLTLSLSKKRKDEKSNYSRSKWFNRKPSFANLGRSKVFVKSICAKPRDPALF